MSRTAYPHLLLDPGGGDGDLGLEPLAAFLEEALLTAVPADLHHVVLAPPPPFLRVHRHLVAVPPNLGPLVRAQRHGWLGFARSLPLGVARCSAGGGEEGQNPSGASGEGEEREEGEKERRNPSGGWESGVKALPTTIEIFFFFLF